jgi:hypothetical protein
MVKNLNTVERGEKVRIGKVQPPTQAVNTIIVNASDTIVQAPHAGTFVSPVRFDNEATTNVLAYNSTTKEIVTTQVVASDKNLQQVTDTGNETNTLVRLLGGAQFSNLTGLGGNVYVDDTGNHGERHLRQGERLPRGEPHDHRGSDVHLIQKHFHHGPNLRVRPE